MTEQDKEGRLTKLQSFLSVDPENTSLLCESANLAIDLNKFDLASELIDKGLEIEKGSAPLQYVSAVLDMTLGRLEEARNTFKLLLLNTEVEPFARYNLAYIYLLEGNSEDAKLIFADHIAHITLSIPTAPILCSKIYHHLGDLHCAKELIESYLQKETSSAEALGLCGLLYADLENYDLAESYASKAIDNDKNTADAYLTLGVCHLSRSDIASAERAFDKAIELNEKSGRGWVGVGLASMAGQKLEKAEKQLETGVLLMPGHIGSWHALAWCRIALSNLSGAEEAFEKSKSIDPNFGETYGGLAVIAVLLGDLEKARTLVRKALRLNKASFAANFANSLMLMKTGNEKVGQENIENLLNTPVDSKGETMIQKINKILSNQDG